MSNEREETMVLVTAGRCVVGRCVHHPGKGWRFLPSVSNHKPSRKFWGDPSASIPKWAMDLGDDLVTFREWERMRHPEERFESGLQPPPDGRMR